MFTWGAPKEQGATYKGLPQVEMATSSGFIILFTFTPALSIWFCFVGFETVYFLLDIIDDNLTLVLGV